MRSLWRDPWVEAGHLFKKCRKRSCSVKNGSTTTFGQTPLHRITIRRKTICSTNKEWREPWFSCYGRRFEFRRLWVWIPALPIYWMDIFHIYWKISLCVERQLTTSESLSAKWEVDFRPWWGSSGQHASIHYDDPSLNQAKFLSFIQGVRRYPQAKDLEHNWLSIQSNSRPIVYKKYSL